MNGFKLHGVRHVSVDLLPNGDGRKTHTLVITFKSGAEVSLIVPFKTSADLERCSTVFEPRTYFLKSNTGRYVCADAKLGFSTTRSQRKAHPFESLESAKTERDRLVKYWQNNISLRVVSTRERDEPTRPRVRVRDEPRTRVVVEDSV